ncbi:hypothetical protein FE257_003527 [Aspergillus nanangensis]|uniref:FYVE-type domain-containing protein n=1 Tax=Aspergillus nanangensis TaxID=2582783 RepID=A0AAD4GNF5_ASPNN|nr:hypothetical protein FE257_003527 [Aspergillus nanangensis]
MSPTPSTNQMSIYGHPSPVNSNTTTPTNNSPTSPRQQYLPLHSRQLRPLKGPLYVPAALRPTERPQKSSPPTPPRSIHGSLDSVDSDELESVSRRSTMETASIGGISKLAQEEWMKHEHLGEVTGTPTRDHWKADAQSATCDSPECRSSFGIFLRRHHCRHCGHIFCSSHTLYAVPLDQEARFHPNGVLSRTCDLCFVAFQRWEEGRADRLNKIQQMLDTQKEEAPAEENVANNPSISQAEGARKYLAAALGQTTEIAASVPRGWNWSTF